MAGDEAFAGLQAKLQELGGEKMRRAQRKALKRVGDLMKDAIVESAGTNLAGGVGVLGPLELRESFGVRVSVPNDEGVLKGRVSKVTIGPRGRTAKLIAADVEYGHGNPRAKKGKAETPEHPFIRPAFDATEAKALAAYEEDMSTFVEKAAK